MTDAAARQGEVNAFILAAASSPAGGWCAWLGKAAGSPVTADDVERIAAFIRERIVNDPKYTALTILLGPLAVLKLNDTVKAIRDDLARWVSSGATCDTIPNNLGELPTVKATLPTEPGQIIGQAVGTLIDWSGLGPVLAKGLVLVGIIVILILALWRVLR